MSNEGEKSDSKFFYCGELFVTELGQWPTYFETECRKKDNTPHKCRSSKSSLCERSQQLADATKKTNYPDKLLGQANRLKAKLLSVEKSIK